MLLNYSNNKECNYNHTKKHWSFIGASYRCGSRDYCDSSYHVMVETTVTVETIVTAVTAVAVETTVTAVTTVTVETAVTTVTVETVDTTVTVETSDSRDYKILLYY